MRFLILLALLLQIPSGLVPTQPPKVTHSLTITPVATRRPRLTATSTPEPAKEKSTPAPGKDATATPEPAKIMEPPQILEGGPQIPIPTPDTDFIANVTLGVYNVANQENILYIIAAILIAAAVLGWAIRTIREPPDYG